MASCVISGMIGFSLGVLLQRMSIHKALGNMPPTICDCCVWKKSNEWRWDAWKSRHRR